MATFMLRLTTLMILGALTAFSASVKNKKSNALTDALGNMRFLENSKFLDTPREDLKRWNKAVAELKSKNQAVETNDIKDGELNPKVIGGRDAEENEFPWMVSLHYIRKFICSAFLISPTVVMTAAHCVNLRNGTEPASAFYGIVGNVAREGPEKRITFSEVVAHPSYGENSEYDIALFRTSQPVEMNDAVQTVCLPANGSTFDEPMAQAMGWGVYQRGNNQDSAETLQTATLPVPSTALCRATYRMLGSTVTDRHVCAGGLNSGICFGDSGGPLVNLNGNGNGNETKPVAIGVASFVSFLGCARPFIPAVYTATSSYIDWLTETVQDTSDICFV